MARNFKAFVEDIEPVRLLMGLALRHASYMNPDDVVVIRKLDKLIFDRKFTNREKTLEDFKGVVKEFARIHHIRISDLCIEAETRWYWNPEVGLVRKKGFRDVSECRFVKRAERNHDQYRNWHYQEWI